MKEFSGKKGVILGVANDHSIAFYIAKALSEAGAEIAYSHLPDSTGKMEKRVRKAIDPLNPALVKPCNVEDDADLERFFGEVKELFGEIDFMVHSVAYAPLDDIRKPTVEASRAGFLQAMNISVYSFIKASSLAKDLMPKDGGGSILTLSYYGGEKVMPGYNMMGVCKAALEMSVRYLAYDLGPKGIRVNAISAGPIKTLAASAVGDFSKMLRLYEFSSPLGRNVAGSEVAKSAIFLLGSSASATSGEILHVDCGFGVMGAMDQSQV